MIAISIVIIHCLAYSSMWGECEGALIFICRLALEIVVPAVFRIYALIEDKV